MPLIACPDCGRPVSNQALQCPSCGFPLRPPPAPRRKVGLLCGLGCGLGCLVGVIATLMLIILFGLLAAAIPAFTKTNDDSQRTACVRHLEEIADLKATWAEKHHATQGAVIPDADLAELAGGRLNRLWCPKDPQHAFSTSYVINPVGEDPVCLCDLSHSLSAADEEEE